MKSIVRYGLLFVALFIAACIGYFFAEHNRDRAERVTFNNATDAAIKQDSVTAQPNFSASPKPHQSVATSATNKFVRLIPKDGSNSSSTQDNSSADQSKPALTNDMSPSEKINTENNQEQSNSYIVPVGFDVSASDIINMLAELPNTMDEKPLGIEKIKNKVLIVAFWASWCGPCRVELSEIDSLIKKMNNPNLELVAVAAEEDIVASRQFLKKIFPQITFSAVTDMNYKLTEYVKLDAMPTVLIINPHTKSSITKYQGYSSGDVHQYEKQIKRFGIVALPIAQNNE